MPTSARSTWRRATTARAAVARVPITRSPLPGAPTTTLDEPSPSVATRPAGRWHGLRLRTGGQPARVGGRSGGAPAPADHLEVVLEWADALLVCGRLADARRVYAPCRRRPRRAPRSGGRAPCSVSAGCGSTSTAGRADRARVLGDSAPPWPRLAGDPSDIAVGLRARLDLRLAAEAVYDGAPVAPVLAALASVPRGRRSRGARRGVVAHPPRAARAEHLDARLAARRGADRGVGPHCGDELWLLLRVALALPLTSSSAGDVRAGPAGSRPSCASGPTPSVAARARYIVAAIDVMRLIREGRLDEAEAGGGDRVRAGRRRRRRRRHRVLRRPPVDDPVVPGP